MRTIPTRIRERLCDAVDLAVDFLTLGEYGLLARSASTCEARRRSGVGIAAVDRGQHLPADPERSLEHLRI
jgi:hypothetical protein